MRLLIAIALFFSIKTKAQVINASRPYRPHIITASCSKLLDNYTGASVAYSLRKLDCDYSGYAIKVRRSSDNTEQDIGFTSNGDLDTTSLKSFVGSNSGYITTWYDQSGNSSNITQSTAGNQPRIVNAGDIDRQGGNPAITFTASSATYLNGGDIVDNDANYLNVFAVAKMSSAATQTVVTKSNADVSADKWALFKLSGSIYNWYIDGYTNRSASASFSSTSNSLFESYSNKSGDSVQIKVNNTQQAINVNAIADGAWNTTYSLLIGAYNGSGGSGVTDGFCMDGTIQEIVIYRSLIQRNSVVSNINSYYSIY